MKTKTYTDIIVRLTPDQAEALANLCKRMGRRDVRELSVSEAETDEMQSALFTLQKALNEEGYDPR